jgi:hypothetical protein
MNNLITAAFLLLIAYWLIVFFYKPAAKRKCTVMDHLTFRKIIIIYPINIHRPEARVKEWNVAVTTVEPDERFADHAGWMMHILTEHVNTLYTIILFEHVELEDTILFYKTSGSINETVITQKELKNHES